MAGSTTLLTEFRPIGGIDNNQTDVSFNALPGNPEPRLAPANFKPGTTDGLIEGPNPRTLSNVVSGGPLADQTDTKASGWLYVFGQFVDHDLDLETLTTKDISIPVPAGDANIAAGSIPVTRATVDPKTGTVTNSIAANLDLSQVYGSDDAKAASLRNADGTLQTSDEGKSLPLVNGRFVAGDVRVMENPELTAVTTLFVREHNHWVGELADQHPNWTGDQLYGMAKAITTAEYQNVVYGQFLPTLVGDAVKPYAGYDASVNSQVSVEFTTSAFRVGHSQVSDEQAGIDNNGEDTFEQTLAESFINSPALTVSNGMDDLLRHLSSDFSQVTDVYAIDGLRNLLFAPPAFLDLIAIDIQRERDLGVNTLNATREAIGLTPYTSFDELTDDPVVAANLESQFGDVANVDLFLGGLAERHADGAQVGETFQRIIADQFTRLRDGDRFYWENQGFDPHTAKAIANTTLGDILTRNTDTPHLQENVFLGAQRHLSNIAAEDPDLSQLVIGVDDDYAVIAGGPADDLIVSGAGIHQTLTGNGGADTFIVQAGNHISDWSADDDKIDLRELAGGTKVQLSDVCGNAVVQYAGATIQIDGVASSSLTAANFLSPDSVKLIGGDCRSLLS